MPASKKFLTEGARVTWFADEDYWGTVTGLPCAGAVAVRWDGSARDSIELRSRVVLRSIPRATQPGPWSPEYLRAMR